MLYLLHRCWISHFSGSRYCPCADHSVRRDTQVCLETFCTIAGPHLTRAGEIPCGFAWPVTWRRNN